MRWERDRVNKDRKVTCVALAGAIVLFFIFGCGREDTAAPAKETHTERPAVSAQRGMRVLWPGYKKPVEIITKRPLEPEAPMTIRLTGDNKPVELSGFHSCAKFFQETVRPPFEARVPYCDDRWESGWVEAGSRAEAEVKLEVLVDGHVRQMATLSNSRPQDHMEYTKALSLRN